MSGRPEHQDPPEMFYNDELARKFTQNKRMIKIQSAMSERAVELLCLPDGKPCHILDLGCGSGFSGETLTDQKHIWTGVDISSARLHVAKVKEVEGDLVLGDLGQGLPFRPGAFDGAISISALQWLCNADKASYNPAQQLQKLFSSLYSCLSRGSRAVFQFYPESDSQVQLITSQAMEAGFTGGLVVDYPYSKEAKKFFLVLVTGGSQDLPAALDKAPLQAASTSKRNRINRRLVRSGKAPNPRIQRILEMRKRYRFMGRF